MDETSTSNAPDSRAKQPDLPQIVGPWTWERLFKPGVGEFVDALAQTIVSRRWFASKTRTISSVAVLDAITLDEGIRLALAEICFTDTTREIYQLPLAFATGPAAGQILAKQKSCVWAQLQADPAAERSVIYDASATERGGAALLKAFDDSQTLGGVHGELGIVQAAGYDRQRGPRHELLPPRLGQAEQSNTSIRYGTRLILKLFRKIDPGRNPDFELSSYLADRGFSAVAPLAGALEYRRAGEEPWTLGLLQTLVDNRGDGWKVTLEDLDALVSKAIEVSTPFAPPVPSITLCAASEQGPSADAIEAFGTSLSSASRLGQRTAQLHLALASEADDPALRPEPFTAGDESAWRQRTVRLIEQAFQLLRAHRGNLEASIVQDADHVLRAEAKIIAELARPQFTSAPMMRIRIHGDYHLGQVLVTSDDFVIIDFEGEPARPLTERRQKQVALRDVAGMIRSFHYASCTVACQAKDRTPHAAQLIDELTASWFFWTSVAFLAAYHKAAGRAAFLPHAPFEFEQLFNLCLIEKAVYELRYELNNRPAWVYLPLTAIVELTDQLGDNAKRW
ncbi:MAG TPA: putative maltokinase [Pirellulales bacterium]|nr:putative maltokinase [Pirellulales bacterium]